MGQANSSPPRRLPSENQPILKSPAQTQKFSGPREEERKKKRFQIFIPKFGPRKPRQPSGAAPGEASEDSDDPSEDNPSEAIQTFRAEADLYSTLTQITHFDLRTLHKLRVIFDDISSSLVPDGLIDAEELRQAMRLQHRDSSVLAQTLFRLFDVTQTQQVNFRTWVSTLSALSQQASLEEKIRFSFSLHDLDGNGTIDGDELRSLLMAAVQERVLSLTPEQVSAVVDHTLRQVDLNGDGKIQYEEYEQLVRQSPRFVELFTLDVGKLCDAFRVSRRHRHIQQRMQEEHQKQLLRREQSIQSQASQEHKDEHRRTTAATPRMPPPRGLESSTPQQTPKMLPRATGPLPNSPTHSSSHPRQPPPLSLPGSEFPEEDPANLSSETIARLVALADRMTEGEVNRRQDAFRGEVSKAAAEGKRVDGSAPITDPGLQEPNWHNESIPRNLLVYGAASPSSPALQPFSAGALDSDRLPQGTPKLSSHHSGPVTVIEDVEDLEL